MTKLLLLFTVIPTAELVLLIQLSAHHYQLRREPDALHFVSTDDGWRLTLTRYLPARAIEGAPPVVLCAGAGVGGVLFDVAESSLARFLSEHGYDTWLFDPRGRGAARAGRRANWSFDDYVELDIPAALRKVCATTGADRVQWVGFGVGAMAMYPVLTGAEGHRVRSLVALAAPVFFGRQQGRFAPGSLRSLRWVPLRSIARLVGPLLGRLYPGPLSTLQNRDNVEGAMYRRALINGLCPLGRTELLQYAEWLEQDSFTAMENRHDYRGPQRGRLHPTRVVFRQRFFFRQHIGRRRRVSGDRHARRRASRSRNHLLGYYWR